jgi:hypothetical protein
MSDVTKPIGAIAGIGTQVLGAGAGMFGGLLGGGGGGGGGGLLGGVLDMSGLPQLAMEGLLIFIGVEVLFKLLDKM